MRLFFMINTTSSLDSVEAPADERDAPSVMRQLLEAMIDFPMALCRKLCLLEKIGLVLFKIISLKLLLLKLKKNSKFLTGFREKE